MLSASSLSLALSLSSSIPNTNYQPESQHCRHIPSAHHPHMCVGSYVEILVLERSSCNGVTIGGRMTTTDYPLLLPSFSPSCRLIYHLNPFVRIQNPWSKYNRPSISWFLDRTLYRVIHWMWIVDIHGMYEWTLTANWER